MKHINSLNNPQVKEWRKLKKKKTRKKTNTYLIEGFHLIQEALIYRKNLINKIILCKDLLEEDEVRKIINHISDSSLIVISEEVAAGISTTETNQGIFAEMKMSLNNQLDKIQAPFLLLDAVQDPGNVGTMIRTADAAGFQAVVLGKGTVDLYNDKTLRSAQGSHFHITIYEIDLKEVILNFKEKAYPVFGTALNQEALSYKEININSPFGLIVGNEGAGLSDEMTELVNQNIYIPMKGNAESLNVAIAASILMFYLN